MMTEMIYCNSRMSFYQILNLFLFPGSVKESWGEGILPGYCYRSTFEPGPMCRVMPPSLARLGSRDLSCSLPGSLCAGSGEGMCPEPGGMDAGRCPLQEGLILR